MNQPAPIGYNPLIQLHSMRTDQLTTSSYYAADSSVQPMDSRGKSPDYAVLFYDQVASGQFRLFCEKQSQLESVTALGKFFDTAVERTAALFSYCKMKTKFLTSYICKRGVLEDSPEVSAFTSSLIKAKSYQDSEQICDLLEPHLQFFEWVSLQLCHYAPRPIDHLFFQMNLGYEPEGELNDSFHWKVRLIHPIDPLLTLFDLDTIYYAPMSISVIEDAIRRTEHWNSSYVQLHIELNCRILLHNEKDKENYLSDSLGKLLIGRSIIGEGATKHFLSLVEKTLCRASASNFEKIDFVVKTIFHQPDRKEEM